MHAKMHDFVAESTHWQVDTVIDIACTNRRKDHTFMIAAAMPKLVMLPQIHLPHPQLIAECAHMLATDPSSLELSVLTDLARLLDFNRLCISCVVTHAKL